MQKQPFPYIVPVCKDNIDILYEDDYLLLINKPAFLLSMPGRHPKNKDSVITRLKLGYPSASLVHRLDLDTSGIMIIPKTKVVHADISKQFQMRKVDKTYIAVVDGLVAQSEGEINLPLKKDWPRPPLQKVCHVEGKASLTQFSVLDRNTTTKETRLSLTPLTGRTHQLRLHCKAIGHPILGCDLYADDNTFNKSKRLLLHAKAIVFVHPVTKKKMEGWCEVPF